MSAVRSLSFALVALAAFALVASLTDTARAANNNSGNRSSSFHSSGNSHCQPSHCYPRYCQPSYCQPNFCQPSFNSCCYCVWYYDCHCCTWKCYQTCGSYSDACFYSNSLKMRGLQVKISRK